jgi:hypothetical protein
LGTHWEFGRNIKGTSWDKRKMKKSPPSPEKTRANHECMLSLLIGCMKFVFPKLFVAIFVSRI